MCAHLILHCIIFFYSAQNHESQSKHATPINCASQLTDQNVVEWNTPKHDLPLTKLQ